MTQPRLIIELPMNPIRLTNAEYYQYHWFITRFMRPKIAAVPQLRVVFERYDNAFKKADIVYKRDPKYVETDEMALRDQIKDSEFKLLGKQLAIELKSLDPARVAAAKPLAKAHHNYKHSPFLPLMANAAQTTNFLDDVDTPENRAALELLGLTSIVERIRVENTAIIDLHEQRAIYINSLHNEGSMTDARAEVDLLYEELVNLINSLFTTNEYTTKDSELRQKLVEIIDGFNAHIEETRTDFVRRTGRKVKGGNSGGSGKPDAGGDETPEPPETPETPDVPETPETPDGPSHLAMVNQRFYGNHPGFSGYATHMSAEAVDPAAFAAALIPAAEGATLRMYTGYEDYFTDFPIESLMVTVDGGSPVPGLVITPQNSNFAFGSTIPDRPELGVEVIKDGEILATIGGVIRPIYVGEG